MKHNQRNLEWQVRRVKNMKNRIGVSRNFIHNQVQSSLKIKREADRNFSYKFPEKTKFYELIAEPMNLEQYICPEAFSELCTFLDKIDPNYEEETPHLIDRFRSLFVVGYTR